MFTSRHATALVWGALAVLAAGAWFLTGTRISYRLGFDAAAPAIGLLVAVAVATTIWRWGRADHDAVALERGACPRCGTALVRRHEHAVPGVRREGQIEWRCPACAFERIEPLTCERCAT
jgi:predicted RNA-binding Zn-ribbon protein involved in translation (DUF1610 family)